MKPRFARGLLLALPLAVYLILPTRNYYWDGVAFAVDIEKHAPLRQLLHPNHLMYALFGSWLYAIGLKTRALFLLQRVNSVLGAVSVFLVYKILRKYDAPEEWSVAGALLLAFSATWWKFSTDADAYIPSIFFLLAAFLLLDRFVWMAAMATAIAMLFHELAIFFLPVAWMKLPKRRVEFVTGSLFPVILAYLAACRVEFGQIRMAQLMQWAVAHSPDSGFSFQPFRDLWLTSRGTLRLIFGGKPDALVGDAFSKVVVVAAIAAIMMFAVALWRERGTLKIAEPPKVLMAWVAIYAAFLFFWMPQNTFYRLFYLPALIAAGMAMFLTMPRARVVASFVTATFLWNLAFEIYPQSRIESNAPLRFALMQHDAWAPGTPVVFSDFHPDLWIIAYFNSQVPWMGLETPDIARLNRDLDYAHRVEKPLWLEADAYQMIASTADGRVWIGEHQRPAETIEYKDAKHEFRFYCMR